MDLTCVPLQCVPGFNDGVVQSLPVVALVYPHCSSLVCKSSCVILAVGPHWHHYDRLSALGNNDLNWRGTLQPRGCFLLPSCVKFVVPHFTTTFCVVEPPVQNQDKKCRLVQNSDKKFRLWKRQQDRVLLHLSSVRGLK